MGRKFDIAIAGGSFAGLAVARALSLASDGAFSIAILDRAAPSATGPEARAFALSAASKRMLETLGVWDAIAPAAEPMTAIEITDSELDAGVRPVLVRFDNVLETGEPATYVVPSHVAMSALISAVQARPDIALLASAEIAEFEAGPHIAHLGLKSGERIEARLVVAADGRRSVLREAAGIRATGWSYGQVGICATIAHARPHGGVAVQHFLPSGPFGILPMRGNRSCITWSEGADEARRVLALDAAGFLAEVDRRFGGRLGPLTLEGGRQSWPLELHLARSYIAARLAVIGDAAHSVHPLAGQGLNLALRDAAALAETVVDAARLGGDLGSAAVLEPYERWRRFDATVSAVAFDGLNRLFSNDSTLLRAGRDIGLGVVDRLPGLKRFFVGEGAGVTGDVPRLLRGEAV